MGSACFGDGVHFEQILSKSSTLCLCIFYSLQALSKSGCWDARHESTLTNPVQKRSVRLSHGNLEHGVILFRRWGAFWADFEQKSRTLCFCIFHSLQALSKSGCWVARHESTLTNPVHKRSVRLRNRNLEHGVILFGPYGVVYIYKGKCRRSVFFFWYPMGRQLHWLQLGRFCCDGQPCRL